MITIPCDTYQNITFSHAQIQGSRHRKNQLPCEDVVLMRDTSDYLFYGLADGQSGTRYGAEGGEVCLNAVFDYVALEGIKSVLDTPFPDELPCAIVKSFRGKLLPLAQNRSISLREFASTLLAIIIDRKTGKYMLIHLGDGYAISIPSTGESTVISAPDSGLSVYHTWLTTSDNAVSHLHVSFGSLDNRKRILMITDGATCFCRNGDIPWRTKDLLKNSTQQELCEYLMLSEPIDDATCIVLDFVDGKSL